MSQVSSLLSRYLKGRIFLFSVLVMGIFSIGMKSGQGHTVVITFKNYFGNDVLKLDSAQYKNELGQSLSISKFKYYVGNISLRSEKNKAFVQKGYWLINEDDPSSCKVVLNNVPEDDYSAMDFTLGVDSVDNCSGAQDGALDPVNAMFWAWNTGYIFLKLEGVAPVSTSPGHIFEFHIGGYKTPNNCVREVLLDLGSSPIKCSASFTSSVDLRVDASELMKTPTTIDLSKISSVTGPQNATTIADNYKDMFSVIKVENGK